jgi:hypothetical protein
MSVQITRAAADPICPRVSVGGTAELGFYVVFRGPSNDCTRALKEALHAMEVAASKLESLPVDRKYKELGAS